MLLLFFYRIVAEIEETLMTNNFNLSSEIITKDNLPEDYIAIKTHMMNDDEFKENKFQSIDVSTSVRDEDIPSFREWTKKQLEEAEKQPGMKKKNVWHLSNLIIIIYYYLQPLMKLNITTIRKY